jgi:hypothetical protein
MSLVKDYKLLNFLTGNKFLLNILIIIFKYYNKLVIIILFIVIIIFLIFNSLEFFILLVGIVAYILSQYRILNFIIRYNKNLNLLSKNFNFCCSISRVLVHTGGGLAALHSAEYLGEIALDYNNSLICKDLPFEQRQAFMEASFRANAARREFKQDMFNRTLKIVTEAPKSLYKDASNSIREL